MRAAVRPFFSFENGRVEGVWEVEGVLKGGLGDEGGEVMKGWCRGVEG